MIAARRVPRDPALPQLAVVLDPGRMRDVFAQALAWREPPALQACAVERVKYRPGRNCVVGYRLTLQDATGASCEQRVCASVYGAEESQTRYRAGLLECDPAQPGTVQRPLLPALSFVAPLNMLVRAFPWDRKLRGLHLLVDARVVESRLLPPVVAARWGAGAGIASIRQRVVSYFPDHTCTVCVDVRLKGVSRRRTWRVYGKMRYDDAGANTFVLMQRLWEVAGQGGASAAYARPLHYDPALRLLWQEAAEGEPLGTLLDTGVPTSTLLQRTASALAGLHASGLAPARVVRMDDLLDALRSAADVVAEAVPECAARVQALKAALLASVPGEGACGTLHGDLHSHNILVGRTRIALIDIDRLSQGPVAAEVGSLLAELAMRECMRGGALERERLEQAADAYAEARGERLDAQALRWHCAGAMLRERALRCVTSLKPGRMEALPALLDAALALLLAPVHTVPVDRAGSAGSAADPGAEPLVTFTDAARMMSALAPVVSPMFRGAHLDALEIEYAWRKIYAKPASWAKSALRVCYRLHLRDEDGRRHTGFVHGEARLSSGSSGAAAHGPGVPGVTIGGVRLPLRAFPEDARLPQLPALFDGMAMPSCLPCARSVEVVRYRPGVRCTLRFALADGSEAFAKTFADHNGAFVFDRARRLHMSGGCNVPEPLAWDAATRTVWMRPADGVPAASPAAPAQALDAAMRCLAALHRSDIVPGHAVARARLLDESRKRAVKLAVCLPQWSDQLGAVMRACESALAALAPASSRPLHGDAHLEQFFVHGDVASALDFDEMILGEPAQDVAAMLVDATLRRPDAGAWRDRALAAYERAAPEPLDAAVLRWHTCLQFVNKAYRLLCRATPSLAPSIDLAMRGAVDRACALQCLQEERS